MGDDKDSAGRPDPVPALFGLLTAKFEDAASHAVEGQSVAGDHQALAQEIDALLAEANILLKAILALVADKMDLDGPRGSGVE